MNVTLRMGMGKLVDVDGLLAPPERPLEVGGGGGSAVEGQHAFTAIASILFLIPKHCFHVWEEYLRNPEVVALDDMAIKRALTRLTLFCSITPHIAAQAELVFKTLKAWNRKALLLFTAAEISQPLCRKLATAIVQGDVSAQTGTYQLLECMVVGYANSQDVQGRSRPELFLSLLPFFTRLLYGLEVQPIGADAPTRRRPCIAVMTRVIHLLVASMDLFPGYPQQYEGVQKVLKHLYPDVVLNPATSWEAINRREWLRKGWGQQQHYVPEFASAASASSSSMMTESFSPRKVDNWVGLENVGNTCFLNSLVQALFALDSFKRFVLACPVTALCKLNNEGEPAHAQASFWRELQSLFARMSLSIQSAVAPRNFIATLPENFKNRTQQDASEFARYVLDRMFSPVLSNVSNAPEPSGNSPETNAKNASSAADPSPPPLPLPSGQAFHGTFRNMIRCTHCGTESARLEPFLDIPLTLNFEAPALEVGADNTKTAVDAQSSASTSPPSQPTIMPEPTTTMSQLAATSAAPTAASAPAAKKNKTSELSGAPAPASALSASSSSSTTAASALALALASSTPVSPSMAAPAPAATETAAPTPLKLPTSAPEETLGMPDTAAAPGLVPTATLTQVLSTPTCPLSSTPDSAIALDTASSAEGVLTLDALLAHFFAAESMEGGHSSHRSQMGGWGPVCFGLVNDRGCDGDG
jgi:hypothetical protein